MSLTTPSVSLTAPMEMDGLGTIGAGIGVLGVTAAADTTEIDGVIKRADSRAGFCKDYREFYEVS
jgi:hypothetical protein